MSHFFFIYPYFLTLSIKFDIFKFCNITLCLKFKVQGIRNKKILKKGGLKNFIEQDI